MMLSGERKRREKKTSPDSHEAKHLSHGIWAVFTHGAGALVYMVLIHV